MSKVILYLNIPRIVRVITILDELFFKISVSFDVIVISNKVFLESSYNIETYLDEVVEVLEVQSSLVFYFCLDEKFIEFW